MRTYPKWVRKIKLVALYGGGGCFGLFVILFIVIVATSDNEKAGSGSAPESPAVVASGHTGATGADPAETEALRGGAPVNLFDAAESGTASEVEAALAAGADPDARTESGFTPLHLAAMDNSNPAVIKALLEGGADPGARDDNDNTPLHAAVWNSNLSVITALLEGGAYPAARNTRGKTPFDYMKDNKALWVTDAYWLLKAALKAALADAPNLFEAAESGTASEVKTALAAGADPNARRKRGGDMPLHLAAIWNDNPAVITALLEAGADPDARSNEYYDRTPLHYAAERNSNLSVIAALLKAGADPAARDEYGDTPLHAAGGNANPSVITALIEAGADPAARNGAGNTPLHAATGSPSPWLADPFRSKPYVIAALLEGGADPDARNEDGDTPLHFAAQIGTASMIAVLIEGGADPDEESSSNLRGNGRWPTPLHRAAAFNSKPSVIKALIEAGADPGARDDAGKTPFDYAKDKEALKGTDAYWLLNDGRFE